MIKDFFSLNDLISEKLNSNEPFSLLRLDNTAGYALQCGFNNTSISEEFFSERALAFEAGINPGTHEYYFNNIAPMLLEAMTDCDILGFVDLSLEIQRDTKFTSKFGEKPMFFGQDTLMVLDPIGVMRGGLTGAFKVETPWTKYLKNKKVLVVSTHCETIKSQWEKMDKIWGNNLETVAPFELVGCIRSPYHPLLDDRQYPDCETWLDNVEYIKKEIDKYDYDVLIGGSTGASPIYAEHAKKRGKVGIQIGGAHQLFFGILGFRWTPEANNGYRVWAEHYNEHWIYPLKEDEARNRDQVRHMEGNYAYWKL